MEGLKKKWGKKGIFNSISASVKRPKTEKVDGGGKPIGRNFYILPFGGS